MNLSLPYREQVRAGREPGWIAESFNNLVSQLTKAYHTQHNADDTHGTITATGSVTERSRDVAIGEWTAVNFTATDFTSSLGTWTVSSSTLLGFAYTLVGLTMTVSWQVDQSTLATTASPVLYVKLPAMAQAARTQFGTFAYDDNGTLGIGVWEVRTAGTQTILRLYKNLRASSNWSVSTSLSYAGQATFEITDAI